MSERLGNILLLYFLVKSRWMPHEHYRAMLQTISFKTFEKGYTLFVMSTSYYECSFVFCVLILTKYTSREGVHESSYIMGETGI